MELINKNNQRDFFVEDEVYHILFFDKTEIVINKDEANLLMTASIDKNNKLVFIKGKTINFSDIKKILSHSEYLYQYPKNQGKSLAELEAEKMEILNMTMDDIFNNLEPYETIDALNSFIGGLQKYINENNPPITSESRKLLKKYEDKLAKAIEQAGFDQSSATEEANKDNSSLANPMELEEKILKNISIQKIFNKNDDIYFENIKKIYADYILTNKISEEKILEKLGVVKLDNNGTIKTVYAEYPILKTRDKGGKEEIFDLGGDIEKLKEKKISLKQDKTIRSAYLENTPKLMSYWIKTRCFFS